MTPIFKAHAQGGRLVFDDREALARHISSLKDGPIEVIVRKARVQRSNSQNAWHWSCIIPLIAEHCGYEHEEVHIALRQRFLTESGEHGLARVKSTTELDTREFTEYAERCRQLAAEMGIVIPDPGEVAA